MNSGERSIGRAQLPYCPRLRRIILDKSETVQITIRDTKHSFNLYEVPPSRVTKHVIGLCIPQSWPEHLGDENWDIVDTNEIESWVSQDLLKTCTSVERVSESDCCQIGTTAIVMGDVNAVCTLECVHRRQSLAARALQERSLLIRGLPFPRTKDDWRRIYRRSYHPQRFFCNFQTCTLIHRPSKCSEDALFDVLQMPTNAGKSGSTLLGEVWGEQQQKKSNIERGLAREPRNQAGRVSMTLMGEIGSCENFVNCYPVVAPAVQAGIRHSDVQMGCRRMACNLSTNELLALPRFARGFLG